MYKIFWLITIGFLTLFFTQASAQNGYSIQLKKVDQMNTKLSCYDIQLASPDKIDFNLAGQNYRLYYNAEEFQFNSEKMNLHLPVQQYSPMIIKDDLANIDATGMGEVPFERHLGFLNLGSDLEDLSNGGIVLPSSGEWVSTVQICFNYLGDSELIPNMELVWAREEKTSSLATAFVEIAEWLAPFETRAAEGIEFGDILLSTSFEEIEKQKNIRIYPNPTTNLVNIDFFAKEATKLQLKSITGQLLQQYTIPKGSTVFQIDLATLPSGLYNVELHSNPLITKRIEKIE